LLFEIEQFLEQCKVVLPHYLSNKPHIGSKGVLIDRDHLDELFKRLVQNGNSHLLVWQGFETETSYIWFFGEKTWTSVLIYIN
jgi:hypothetical protein